mgnify:FL=1|tara:strand:+ start:248 stop:379 length:132 start_codon:yes stop_codon:yes gene_type:complete
MTKSDLRDILVKHLGGIAPEIDIARIDTTADLRDEYDIDSMDF